MQAKWAACGVLAMILASAASAQAQPQRAAAAPPAPALQQVPDLSRSTFLANMDAEFRQRDVDHDGKITRAEAERFEAAQATVAAQQQNRRLFTQIDLDRNGALSPAEFAALVPLQTTPNVQPLMNWLDPNRDQVITLIEYRAGKLANFDKIDTDHDGVLTAAEMRTVGIGGR